jgi:4-amino-4-deoxy-L-arabinose transferase-like glycosyltransferase
MTTSLAEPVPAPAGSPPATPLAADTAQRSGPTPGRAGRLLRGDADEPRWARPGLLGLLLGTAVLYLYQLGSSGTANSFYAAAVQAGTKSWKAFFFGSFDSSNFITVDKPPASLWVMELSGRIFGFSSWSMLAPQAIEGVLAVALLYGAVRRIAGPAAGLAAGAMLALTPAAALMFRFNNPDALLVLLLVAAAYCTVRALESGRTGWLMLVGTAVGFGFLTKMGQALLVLPAFALGYLLAGPPRLGRRIAQLLLGGLAMVLSAGWWVAVVELMPASARPYIGGSTNNSILDLAFGYNGLGRLFGGSGNGGGGGTSAASAAARASSAGAPSIGGGQNGGFGGATGLARLLSSEMAVEISWLLPAALIALVGGLWLTRRAPRTDLTRASLVIWGGWLVGTGLVFSYMAGTIHPYYTVALAPAIAALVATTATISWRRRTTVTARLTGVAMLLATGLWTYHLLATNASWYPALRYLAVAFAVLASLALLGVRRWRRGALVAAAAAGAILISGSGAYAVATASVPHTGSIPSVGPSGSGAARTGGLAGAPTGSGGFSAGPGGIPPTGGTGAPAGAAGATGVSGAGVSAGSTGNSALVTLLKASTAKWAAAADSSMTAGSLELSSGQAVMSIGGFNGSDSAISLTTFKTLVAQGKIGYFIAGSSNGGNGGGGGNSGNAYSQISSWVASNFTATTAGSTTSYKLTTGS